MIRETTKWTWHVLAGLVILVLAGLHMLIMHLDDILGWFNPNAGGSVLWENVIHRGQLAFFNITYVILLAAALYHGLYGLKVVLFELNPPRGVQRAISGLVWAMGIVLFGIGVATVILAPGAHGPA